MRLRHGFKAEANWYARDVRRDLGLAPDAPLSPWKLAEFLGYPMSKLSEFMKQQPEMVAYFRSPAGQRDFSAITLFDGGFRFIVYNDAHHPKRQAADIAHEIAHGLLHHPPKPAFDVTGSRHYDPVKEAEANWLGPALLISEEAAIAIVRGGYSVNDASDIYAVSDDVVQMRLNVCGAYARLARRRA